MVEPCFNWSDAAIARLKELAEQGYSSSQIANELGAPSRNSVIGKAAREGIALAKWHAHVVPKRDSKPKEKKPRTFGTLPFMPPKAAVTVVAPTSVADEPSDIPMVRRLSIMELRSNSCRWPLGDPRADDFSYCGADAALGRSYCPCHHRMSYASNSQPYEKPVPAPKKSVVAALKAAIAAEMSGAANG